MMPKMKKTKKQRRRTLPNMGNVSNNSITNIRIPENDISLSQNVIRFNQTAVIIVIVIYLIPKSKSLETFM